MRVRDNYTTEAIKAEIINDSKADKDKIEAEKRKIIVSDEAMLNAEVISDLTKQLNNLLRTFIR